MTSGMLTASSIAHAQVRNDYVCARCMFESLGYKDEDEIVASFAPTERALRWFHSMQLAGRNYLLSDEAEF